MHLGGLPVVGNLLRGNEMYFFKMGNPHKEPGVAGVVATNDVASG